MPAVVGNLSLRDRAPGHGQTDITDCRVPVGSLDSQRTGFPSLRQPPDNFISHPDYIFMPILGVCEVKTKTLIFTTRKDSVIHSVVTRILIEFWFSNVAVDFIST